MERVTVYIDGFNLYYGLRAKNWQRYYWLDVRRLSEHLLRPNQLLVGVHYFTTKVFRDPNNPGKFTRQRTFLQATELLQGVRIHYGYYLSKKMSCSICGSTWQTYEEKMTDVNIAVQLLGDAQDKVFDTAIVISADSDLAGPVKAVRSRYPTSGRSLLSHLSGPLSCASRHRIFCIGRDVLRDSQLPNRITKPDGYVLTRPPTWN